MRLLPARVRPLTITCCLLIAGFSFADDSSAPRGDSETLEITSGTVEKHIRYLAGEELKGRSGDESRIAAAYIRSHFQRLGLKPLFDGNEYLQSIPGATGDDGIRPEMGRNVGAWLPGADPELRDEFVIVSAHYDHLGVRGGKTFPGADDNASGTSMLLEVARQFAVSKSRPRRSIAFVGFDLEERMLWGSRWFAAHPPWPIEQVKFFITADMIGRSLGDLPLPTVFVLGSEHSPQVRDALDRISVPDGLEMARLGVDLIGTRSDYGPFRDRRIPFLFFSTGEHPDYHSPRDTPDQIDYDKVARVSSLVLRLTRHVAGADSAPEWTGDVEPDVNEAKALNRIAVLLAEAEEERGFSSLQMTLISHVRTKTGQIVERGTMTSAERTWLIRVSQLLLLSVF